MQSWDPKWTPKPAKSGDSNGCPESKPRGVSPELPQRAQDLPKRGPRHPKTAQDRLQTGQDKHKPGPRVFERCRREAPESSKQLETGPRPVQARQRCITSSVLQHKQNRTGKNTIFYQLGFLLLLQLGRLRNAKQQAEPVRPVLPSQG